MVDKRKPTSETPRSAESSHKRRKVTDAGSPPAATPTRPGQPNLTESEKEKLKAFLDSKAKASGIAFPIQYLQPRLKKKKKGKKGHKETKTPAAIVEEQLSLGGQSYGRVRYVVQNRPKWEQLTRYKKCSVGEETIEQGECVVVKGDSSTDPESAEDPTLPQWKAQLLEVRAFNENHVYVKVAWLYRPDHDIPSGPTNYHGKYELIPSTEISIIDAASVNGSIKVKYWDEYKDDDVPIAEEYYWRQSYDHLTGTLSSCRQVCVCSQPHNPDRLIIQCKHCDQWMHAACLEDATVKAYKDETAQTSGEAAEEPPVVETNEETVVVTPKQSTSKPTKGKKSKNKGAMDAKIDIAPTAPADKVTAAFEVGGRDAENGKEVGQSKIVVTDTRGEEPITQERDIKCLFEECGEPIDD